MTNYMLNNGHIMCSGALEQRKSCQNTIPISCHPPDLAQAAAHVPKLFAQACARARHLGTPADNML